MLLRLTEGEYELLCAAAADTGWTPTGYAAEAALHAAREAVGTDDDGEGERDERSAGLVELMRSRAQLRRIGVNLNQAVAGLNATGAPPAWLETVVDHVAQAVERNDRAAAALAAKLLRGRR